MPADYVIEKEKRVVITTAWSRVTVEDFKAQQDRLLSDPNFDPEFSQLLDATRVTESDIGTDEVRTLTSRTVFSPKSKRAFVAVNPAYFGLGRVRELICP